MGGEGKYFQMQSEPAYTSNVERIYIGNIENLQSYNWENTMTLEEHKVWTQPVVIDDIDSVYIIGGYGYENQRANPWYTRSTVEIIDTELDTITEDTSLHYPVYSAAAVYVSSLRKIYVLGGTD